ncbi:lytic transglycosylase domain-containing protein [Spongiactinospora rosea]|uniref:Lytic transglycosylase domain-containing protein n=1 Tax=Spongiactinospora rosea TaxID=2248750 RepID=A0A366M097_9ACTN|nr:lytic transglycosylase domain-containing protein [Spongiactinospora rosea]RBQ19658.1 lytic transglycosylase domain-containing protein [Spongiactinospora rosea]
MSPAARSSYLPVVLAGLTATIVVTAVVAGYLLFRPERSVGSVRADGVVAGGGKALTALDRMVPTTAPHAAPAPTASAPAPRMTGGPGVTPTPPVVFAVAQASVPRATLHKISALKHVQKIAAVDAGTIRVSGTAISLLAVNPAEFRAWTPKAVAGEPGVWDAIARGEVVADARAVRRLGMVQGTDYQVDNGPRLRLGVSAELGLPGVDGLVSVRVGRGLGLLPGVAVLVHGADEHAEALTSKVRTALGEGSQVAAVGEAAKRVIKAAEAAETAKDDAAPPKAPQRVVVGRPGSYLELYQVSAKVCPGLSWTVLAAIGQVESSHGRNNGPSSAGALGPMQFMPATWKAYGVDGDGDGKADIWSPYDAVPSAANYLCANGANRGGKKLEKAVWFYNHSWSYVRKVLGVAEGYARQYG